MARTQQARSEPASQPPLFFLSHSGDESEAAKTLAAALRGAGVEVWLDVDRLRPGDRWQHEIGTALQSAQAFLLYVGRTAVDRWVDFEVQIALDRAAKDRRFRLIPVLGPGADPAALPDFVKLFQWIDLRSSPIPAPETLRALLSGQAPSTSEAVPVLLPERPPFRGLLTFDVEDAVVFFGRERETEDLLKLLGRTPFLLVIGDSGCGKSSLVRAGLVPALLRGRFHDGRAWMRDWCVAITRPGNDPFGELAESLPDLAGGTGDRPAQVHRNRKLLAEGSDGLRDIVAGTVRSGARSLLVIDQFEELFIHMPEAAGRRRYIDSLLRAGNLAGSRPVHVVATLRADFFARCWESPELLERVRECSYVTPRLPAERLRELIERPLAMAGAQAEPGLVQTLLDDVGDQPGNLALLEHALDQLWQQPRHTGGTRWITHEAYQAFGRLDGALRHHANGAMERLPGEAERALARRFFVDLTQLGEGTEDTRRRVRIEELIAAAPDRNQAIGLLERLASERLILTGDQHAEVVHEALIRSWTELRQWIDADRDFLRRERRFLEDAKEWERLARDPEALLRGARLQEAEAWLADAPREVPPLILRLIVASGEARSREEAAREQHRQAELSRLRRTRTVAAVAAGVFIALTLVASYFWQSAQKATRTALARGLAAQAQLIEFNRPEALETRARLAAESLRRQALPENERAVRAALALLGKPVARLPHEEPLQLAAFTPDSQRLSSLDLNNVLREWEVRSGRKIHEITLFWDWVQAAALNRPAQRLVNSNDNQEVRVWSTATWQEIAKKRYEREVRSVALSPDGARIANGGDNGTVSIWEVETGQEIARFEHGGQVRTVAFSPDGSQGVSGGDDGTAKIWDVATGREIVRFHHPKPVTSAVFSPDGRRVASGGATVQIWEVATGREIAQAGTGKVLQSLAFSSDGQRLLGGSRDGTARVWEAGTGRELARVEHSTGVGAVGVSPDGKWLASGSDDGDLRIWEVVPELKRKLTSVELFHAAFSPDGTQIAGLVADNTVRVWQTATGRELGRFRELQQDYRFGWIAFRSEDRWTLGDVMSEATTWEMSTGRASSLAEESASGTAIAYSRDGKLSAVGTGHINPSLRLWDLATNRQIAEVEHRGRINALAFSPDGKRLASGTNTGTLRVWDVAKAKPVVQIEQWQAIKTAAFSPDGRQVVVGLYPLERKSEARVWDWASRKEIARVELDAEIDAVAFSPDSRQLAVVSGGAVSFHAIGAEELLRQICQRLWDNFSRAEWERYLPGEPYQRTCPDLPDGE